MPVMPSNKPLSMMDEPDTLLLVLEENFPFTFVEVPKLKIDYACEY
jgi:hypothetical protein